MIFDHRLCSTVTYATPGRLGTLLSTSTARHCTAQHSTKWNGSMPERDRSSHLSTPTSHSTTARSSLVSSHVISCPPILSHSVLRPPSVETKTIIRIDRSRTVRSRCVDVMHMQVQKSYQRGFTLSTKRENELVREKKNMHHGRLQ